MTAEAEPMVKAESVHKRFGRLEVLKGVSLEIESGQVVCIIGPSGSGKSTFLRCINHLEKIDAGRLWVDGELVFSIEIVSFPVGGMITRIACGSTILRMVSRRVIPRACAASV